MHSLRKPLASSFIEDYHDHCLKNADIILNGKANDVLCAGYIRQQLDIFNIKVDHKYFSTIISKMVSNGKVAFKTQNKFASAIFMPKLDKTLTKLIMNPLKLTQNCNNTSENIIHTIKYRVTITNALPRCAFECGLIGVPNTVCDIGYKEFEYSVKQFINAKNLNIMTLDHINKRVSPTFRALTMYYLRCESFESSKLPRKIVNYRTESTLRVIRQSNSDRVAIGGGVMNKDKLKKAVSQANRGDIIDACIVYDKEYSIFGLYFEKYFQVSNVIKVGVSIDKDRPAWLDLDSYVYYFAVLFHQPKKSDKSIEFNVQMVDI